MLTSVAPMCLLLAALALLSTQAVPFIKSSSSTSSSKTAFVRRNSGLYSIRSGGLFDKLSGSASNTTDASSSEATKKYPAMTQAEVEAALNHVPIFAVTNADGNGIVLRDATDEGKGVFYWFFDPKQANETLTQLIASGNDNATAGLKLSAFSLGKMFVASEA